MSNVHYTTSQTDNTYRVELANYFEEYPKIMFNSEWSYFVGLTYKTNNTSDKLARRRLKVLYKYLRYDNRKSEGIYVTEYDCGFDRIHHHVLLYSELSLSDVTYRVNKYWGKIGRVDVQKYDVSQSPCRYMVKHINKSEKNTYDFLI